MKDIAGNDITIDVRHPLGNKLYMQGHDISICDLGQDIYYSLGEMTLNEEQSRAVLQAVEEYPYVTRSAIKNLLK